MITLKSHGFKYSRPEANMVFDVSFFKNPWRDESIRNEADAEKRKDLIMAYMKNQEGCETFIERIASLLRFMHMMYPNESLKVALCCSAGEYRSPAMVIMLGEKLEKVGIPIIIEQSKESKI